MTLGRLLHPWAAFKSAMRHLIRSELQTFAEASQSGLETHLDALASAQAGRDEDQQTRLAYLDHARGLQMEMLVESVRSHSAAGAVDATARLEPVLTRLAAIDAQLTRVAAAVDGSGLGEAVADLADLTRRAAEASASSLNAAETANASAIAAPDRAANIAFDLLAPRILEVANAISGLSNQLAELRMVADRALGAAEPTAAPRALSSNQDVATTGSTTSVSSVGDFRRQAEAARAAAEAVRAALATQGRPAG